MICFLALFCSRASAVTYTWTGNGGGLLFSLLGNWTGGVPLSASTTDLVLSGSVNTGTAASPLNQDLGLGAFTLNSLTFDSTAGNFFLSGNAFAFGGSTNAITQNSSNAQNVTNALTSASNKAITLTLGGNGSGVVTLGGQITPGKGLSIVKSGTSTFSLTGANTYDGATNITAGVLDIQNAQALGTIDAGTTVASGASLQLQGGIAVGAEGLSLNGSGIGGTGALRNISGNNSFGGAITLASASAIGSDAGNLTLSGVISGSYALTKVGAGTLTLTGANTFTGTLTVQNGTLSFGTPSLGNSANALVLGGAGTTGILQYTGTGGTTSRTFTLAAAGTGVFDVTNSAATLTIAGVVTGSGGLAKTSRGTLLLSGSNTFTGATMVSAGTLRLGGNEKLADAGSLTIASGTFDLQGFNERVGALTMTGGSITGTGTLTASSYNLQGGSLAVIVGGSASVIKSTSGTVTLNSANTYTGSTAVNAGLLQVNTNNALGAAANGTTVANGAALALNSVNYATVESLTLNGSGINNGGALVNSGTSTYAGAITAATHATIHAGGGTLNLTGGLVKDGTTLTLTGGGTINVSGAGISGSSPNSDLVVDGTTVVLNAASTYNGPTTVQNSGILQLGANNVLPAAPQTAMTINTAGSLNMASYSDGVASLAGDTSGTVRNSVTGTTSTLSVNPANGIGSTFAGTIAGTAGGTQGDLALVKSGEGSLVLTGVNTFTGATNVDSGTLVAAASSGSALGTTTSITVNSGGTLLLGASDQINNTAPVNLAGGTIATGNFSEGTASSAGFGALTLAADSTLDFGSASATLSFASFNPDGFSLVINNWSGVANTVGSSTTDRLIFTGDQTSNLGAFNFTGYSGATQFDLGGGYYEIAPMTPVPEPSTYAAAALALLGVGFQQRARLKRLLHRRAANA